MTKKYFGLLTIIVFMVTNCSKEEDFGISYKISSLLELSNSTELDRTNQIDECRLDDSFFFLEEEMQLRVEMNDNKCPRDPNEFYGGIIEFLEVDSLSIEILELSFPFDYKVHDSFLLSQPISQSDVQRYEVIEFNEEIIRLQSNIHFTEPKTQNNWQIILTRDE